MCILTYLCLFFCEMALDNRLFNFKHLTRKNWHFVQYECFLKRFHSKICPYGGNDSIYFVDSRKIT